MKLKLLEKRRYLILLVDRKRARMFTFVKDESRKEDRNEQEIVDGLVPQNVKHGDDTWDAQDKIFRHIEDHLHRHLTIITQAVEKYVKTNKITDIVVGGHKPLFSKVREHLSTELNKIVRGEFVTELKAPLGEIIKRAKKTIEKIELEEKRNSLRKRYELSVSLQKRK